MLNDLQDGSYLNFHFSKRTRKMAMNAHEVALIYKETLKGSNVINITHES